MKRGMMLALLLAALFCLGFACAEEYASGDFEYILLEDGTAEITGYRGNAKSLDIPAELDGHAVTSIGKDAFTLRTTLTTVTIPEGVTSISEAAFHRCSRLSSITIPASVTVIGEEAFYFCEALQSVAIPEGVITIGDDAFAYCGGLHTITIPDSVADLSGNPFAACPELTQISVSPDHPVLEMIDGVLFDKVEKKLVCYPYALSNESYEIPEGTLAIGAYAFSDDDTLTSVVIPAGVTAIEDGAFSSCAVLTSVVIPASVTEISDSAFSNNAASMVLIVEPGSPAEQYAGANNLACAHPEA